jgi:hypothetical protein
VPITTPTPGFAVTGTSQNPSPLASGNIYNPVAVGPVTPQMTKVGPVMGASESPPPGSTIQHIRTKSGQTVPGFLQPDGIFRPRPGAS